MATEQDVVKVLGYMAAAWPRFEITAETVAVYVMHLLRTRLAADVLLLAAIHLVDSSEFFPSVAALKAEAEQIERHRNWWYLTANCRLAGEPLSEELLLPPGLAQSVLEYEVMPSAPTLLPPNHSSGELTPPRVGTCDVWRVALNLLEGQMARSTYDAYLRATTADEQGDELTVYVRDAAAAHWLGTRLRALVEQAVGDVFQRPMTVRYEVVGG